MSLQDIDESFKLPIEYDAGNTQLTDEIIADLELRDISGNPGLYNNAFDTSTTFGNYISNKYSVSYTHNKEYLEDTQTIIKKICAREESFIIEPRTEKVCETWFDIKNDTNFLDKYQYVDVEFFKPLNSRADFLQF